MGCYGFDCGTYNLVVSRRNENNEIKSKKEINAFIEVSKENPFAFNMLKKAGISLLEKDDMAYVLGEAAVNIAYTLKLELKRPMQNGCLNPKEKSAFYILGRMMHSMLGEVSKDGENLCYSVPANAVNFDTDADYHQKVLDDIFKRYKVNNKTVKAMPINEGLAVVFSELADKAFTGIGVSFGSGMVNCCLAVFSQPFLSFSSARSGDWIDAQCAKATGETATVINREKTKVDLSKTPTTLIERAVVSQYRILVEKTIQNIKKAIIDAGNKVKVENPLDMVVTGGVASPPHFKDLFCEVLKTANLPIPIGEVILPEDNLYSVSKGCLIGAENV